MSRNVPYDKPLSDKDRAYLLARGRQDTVNMLDARNAKDESEPETSGDGEDNYDDDAAWSYRALQEEAGKRELPKSGSREELVARLRAFDAEQQ